MNAAQKKQCHAVVAGQRCRKMITYESYYHGDPAIMSVEGSGSWHRKLAKMPSVVKVHLCRNHGG